MARRRPRSAAADRRPVLPLPFVLSSPHVDVALTGPASTAQLDENLDALEHGPLSPKEDAWIREYGRKVASKKKLPFM